MEITSTILKTKKYVHVCFSKWLLRENSKVIVIHTFFFSIKLFRNRDGVNGNSLCCQKNKLRN